MAALLASIADLPPTDPRHEAAHTAAGLLRSAWEDDVALACRSRADTSDGLRAKAELAATLFDRERDGAVVGGPAVRLAASLADDLLSGIQHRAQRGSGVSLILQEVARRATEQTLKTRRPARELTANLKQKTI